MPKDGDSGEQRLWSKTFDRDFRHIIDSIRSGDLARALDAADQVAKRAQEADDHYALGRARMFAAEVRLLRGEIALARTLAAEAERLLRRIELWGGVSRVNRLLADV